MKANYNTIRDRWFHVTVSDAASIVYGFGDLRPALKFARTAIETKAPHVVVKNELGAVLLDSHN